MRTTLTLTALAITAALTTSCSSTRRMESRGQALGTAINLPSDFSPRQEDFIGKDKRGFFMGLRKFKGRPLAERNGVNGLYVVSAIAGRFDHDPIVIGDIILAIDGQPLKGNPAYHFKTSVGRALQGDGMLTISRWRKGVAETFTLNMNLTPPDLTNGGVINDLHDWQLGPTGMNGWLFSQKMDNGASRDARQIKVTLIEEGSPADGNVMLDDVIVGVDGEAFTHDARRALAAAIVEAEKKANEGRLDLLIWRKGETRTVSLTLPILPDPGPDAPYDCPKTAALIDGACNFLKAKPLKPNWLGYINAVGMLATGHQDLMPKLTAFAHEICIPGEVLNVDVHQSMLCWTWSYKLIFLCEYYLRTEDKHVLPTITEYATKLAMGQSGVGTWGHSVASRGYNDGKLHGRLGGYGAINQMGLTAMVGLPLALKCGVDNREIRDAIERGETFFSYYIDKGAIPYGDHAPNTRWFDDNGKSGSAAVMFDLIGNQRGAAFYSGMVIGSAPSGREAGHTGHFWSHLWGGVGAARSGRTAMRSFMNEMDYVFTLERGTAGNFVFQGNAGEAGKQGESKNKSWDCTGARLLQLCAPRKAIYITGRDMTVAAPLQANRIKELFAAGALYSNKADRKALPKADILQLLGDEMPAVRMTGARAMREQNLNCVPELIAMLSSENRYARYGACYALKESGYGSQAAVARLIELMESSDDLDLRLNAIDALTAGDPKLSLAASAKSAIPSLLRLTVKRFDLDPRRLLQRRLAFALFTRSGLITLHGIADVDSELLLPAIRELLTADDGRARGLVSSIYPSLKPEDREALWPDIYTATQEIAPSGIMFADGIRASGLKLMEQHDVAEGIDLAIDFMLEDRWGKGGRQAAALEVLTAYGPAAKKALPHLEKLKRGKLKPEQLAEVEAAIGAIETGSARALESIL
ncbi:MAG: hypothetical protein HN919_05420 [Verrucomicrobia bacterium]|jgi:hypothetical protein|nr:hypothetical protein [Verrucomicrobiota bacterium]MBT7065719.1 hypothetical protein [Verrucomicrobiota bacterium]MBT7701989.1 hypothetical protein [Verrucomicrobiota bacterium]